MTTPRGPWWALANATPSGLDNDRRAALAKAIHDLVVAEREACAKIADGELMEVGDAGQERIVRSIAEQIRNRATGA